VVSSLLSTSLLSSGQRPLGLRLLVSVRDVGEARIAVECGADIIDAKDPTRGPLGPVSGHQLRAIVAAVGSHRPVSAAIGDLEGWKALDACEAAAAGVTFVKVGCDRGQSAHGMVEQIGRVSESVQRHSAAGHPCRVVLAAYADGPAGWASPEAVVDLAIQSGATGVLLDTLHKGGPRLFDVMRPDDVARWVAAGHAAGLMVALAGSLRLEDIAAARATGADVVGVRGAACEGGRDGRLSAMRVKALVAEAAASGRRVPAPIAQLALEEVGRNE
jgi:(5-formylfuran-3-yl)methyl phosphate synthase